MILDQITLAGRYAYLRGEGTNDVNVASQPATAVEGVGPVRRVNSLSIGKGMVVAVSGIQLYMEREGILDLCARGTDPLITLRVNKEVFPGLFADPYARRIHRIAGFEDFSRGALNNFRVMEVDGVATLVSTSTQLCRWSSPVYLMPGTVPIASIAWALPTHKETPAESFAYDVSLRTWQSDPSGSAPVVHRAAVGATPADPRFLHLEPALMARAYQVEFAATVHHDAPLSEMHMADMTRESLGRPLLTGAYLLESVPSSYSFYSLAELLAQASGYEVLGPQGSRLLVLLDFEAVLAAGESVVLELHGDPAPLTRLEARMLGSVVVRPPRADGRD